MATCFSLLAVSTENAAESTRGFGFNVWKGVFWKSVVKHGDGFLRKERGMFFGSFPNKNSPAGTRRGPGVKC